LTWLSECVLMIEIDNLNHHLTASIRIAKPLRIQSEISYTSTIFLSLRTRI